MTQCRIIAEVGSNWDGDRDTALAYVDAAAEVGADAVKFQTMAIDRLVAPTIQRRAGGQWEPNPVFEHITNRELPAAWHEELADRARRRGVEFLSTPFHLDAVDLLERIGVARYKIASGDITFGPLLDRVGATGKPVLLSTGASYLGEVRTAVDRLEAAGSGPVSVLHCVANYPPTMDELNLRAVATLATELDRPVGLSDHSPGIGAPIAALALGASVVEKHITFDRGGQGPDHAYALEMDEFAAMVRELRGVEQGLGDGVKAPTETEHPRVVRMRRQPYDPATMRPTHGEEGIWLRPAGPMPA